MTALLPRTRWFLLPLLVGLALAAAGGAAHAWDDAEVTTIDERVTGVDPITERSRDDTETWEWTVRNDGARPIEVRAFLTTNTSLRHGSGDGGANVTVWAFAADDRAGVTQLVDGLGPGGSWWDRHIIKVRARVEPGDFVVVRAERTITLFDNPSDAPFLVTNELARIEVTQRVVGETGLAQAALYGGAATVAASVVAGGFVALRRYARTQDVW